MSSRLRSWFAQAVVATMVYGGFGLVEPLGEILVPSTPAERQARADSMLLAAQLVVARAAADTLQVWLDQANARFAEACRMLPIGTAEECRDVVDARVARQGSR